MIPCAQAQQTVRERINTLVFAGEDLYRMPFGPEDIESFRHIGHCPEHDRTCIAIGYLLKTACTTNTVPNIPEPLW